MICLLKMCSASGSLLWAPGGAHPDGGADVMGHVVDERDHAAGRQRQVDYLQRCASDGVDFTLEPAAPHGVIVVGPRGIPLVGNAV